MDLLTRPELHALAATADGQRVSVFLPTHRAGRETQQDPIRLKNLLREAEGQLVRGGLRAPEAEALLRPGRDLLDDAMFWRHQADGLALFLGHRFQRRYRLPLALPELIVVAPRFHLKPLLPLLTGDGRFFVLAMSQNRTQLYEATRYTIREVAVDGMPASLAEVLRYDDPERQLQFHTGAPAAGGRRAAIFHGHGAGDDAGSNLLRYCQQVDAALRQVLADERGPLVLAGTTELIARYRQASALPHLLDEGIPGNPDESAPEALHEKAWALVGARFRRARQESAARYAALAGTPQASADLDQVVLGAHDGRVDVLFVAVGTQVWGRVDPVRRTVTRDEQPSPENEDLLDSAAAQTLLHGGTVYAEEPTRVPGGAAIAAIWRY